MELPVAGSQKAPTRTEHWPGVQSVVFGYVAVGHGGWGGSAFPWRVTTPMLPGPVGKQGRSVRLEQQSWLNPPFASTQVVVPLT